MPGCNGRRLGSDKIEVRMGQDKDEEPNGTRVREQTDPGYPNRAKAQVSSRARTSKSRIETKSEH